MAGHPNFVSTSSLLNCLHRLGPNFGINNRHTLRFLRQTRNGGTKEKFHPRDLVDTSALPPEQNRLLKPVAFTAGVCIASYIGATCWQYENLRKKFLGIAAPARRTVNSWYEGAKRSEWRNQVNRWWKSLPEYKKLFYPLLFANGLVFLAWRVGRCHLLMTKWFCSNPGGKAVCWPMLLSNFSHYSALHLAANMFVLNSFMIPSVGSLGMEQFLGLYVSAGVFSALASHVYKLAIRKNALSLGASGAILAIFSFTCCELPNSQLQLIFLPGVHFSAQTALVGAMALDVAGILFGWKLFDHAAHLGGALFGLFWYKYGDAIWAKRGPVLQWWHSIRQKPVA